MKRAVLLALAIVATATGFVSQAAAGDYLDDRSTPESLVRSLYNAVNRHEYGRAWSYFAEPPAKTVDDYAKGYQGTSRVVVRIGPAAEDGAAGSVFYNLPVAIQALQENGESRVFAGCYELRRANPQAQAAGFQPLQIVRGKLAPASGAIEDAVPETCGNAPTPSLSDVMLQRAKTLFRSAMAETCMTLDPSIDSFQPSELEPETFELHFRNKYDSDSDPERVAQLYRFVCNRGAYNESAIYVIGSDEGYKVLSFALPELDIRYENDDPDGKVTAIHVTGFQTESEVTNPDFDANTMTLTSFAKWRGVGDASSIGTWIFRYGEFSLVKYEVDASYDGEINPETVVDYLTGP